MRAHLTTEGGKTAAREVATELVGTLRDGPLLANTVSFNTRWTVFKSPKAVLLRSGILLPMAPLTWCRRFFGTTGPHSPCASRAAQIPFGSGVEIDFVVEIVERTIHPRNI